MPAQICPVHQAVTTLGEIINAGQLKTPRNRWTVEEIRTLFNDIAWGNAGAEHLPAVEAKLRQLKSECADDACREVADFIESALSQNLRLRSPTDQSTQVFQSPGLPPQPLRRAR